MPNKNMHSILLILFIIFPISTWAKTTYKFGWFNLSGFNLNYLSASGIRDSAIPKQLKSTIHAGEYIPLSCDFWDDYTKGDWCSMTLSITTEEGVEIGQVTIKNSQHYSKTLFEKNTFIRPYFISRATISLVNETPYTQTNACRDRCWTSWDKKNENWFILPPESVDATPKNANF